MELSLDDREISKELEYYMQTMAALSDKLTVTYADKADKPCVHVLRADGSDAGMTFHGVPGGHEFNSFIVGLYNAAGPGQAVDEAVMEQIKNINKPLSLKVLVSLSCTMCPELVMAAERIAAANSCVTVDVYDLNHFPDLRKKYNIMSVPCLVINDDKTIFGKKNIEELTAILSA